MVPKLYGFATATCTLRVAVVLHEKRIPYEFHNIDLMNGEQKTAAFLEKQPFGLVPYLDDGGIIIYESRAIARYIEAKWPDSGPRLSVLPSDPVAFAHFEQACSIEQSGFDPHVNPVVANLIYYPKFGKQPDLDLVARSLQTLDAKFDAYEKILAKQKYLAGDELTLADLFHLPYGSHLPACGFKALEDGSKPNVARWWKDISSRPAWISVKDGVLGLKA